MALYELQGSTGKKEGLTAGLRANNGRLVRQHEREVFDTYILRWLKSMSVICARLARRFSSRIFSDTYTA